MSKGQRADESVEHSELDTGPDGRNAESEVFPSTCDVLTSYGVAGFCGKAETCGGGRAREMEASVLHHSCKLRLCRETFDGLDQVLIRSAVPSNHLAQRWQHIEAVLLVRLGQKGHVDFAKLETAKHAAGLQDAVGLLEHLVNVRAVTDAESDRVQVDRFVGNRLTLERRQVGLLAVGPAHGLGWHGHGRIELLSVAKLEAYLRPAPVHGLLESLLSFLEHTRVDVEHSDVRLAVKVLCPGVVQNTQRNVSRTSGYVENLDATARIQLGNKVILPQPMDAQRHGIVHHIVLGRY